MLDFKKILSDIEEMTPTEGFNLVVVDTFGAPDEQGLQLVGHFKTIEEAEAAKADNEKHYPGQAFYIYEPEKKKASPAKAFMKGQAEPEPEPEPE